MAANITVNGGSAGVGTLNAPVGVSVALADVGGGSPASRAWSIENWPSPLATAPVVTNPTSNLASFTPSVDGIYQVKLLRLEADNVTTTTQSVLVCVPDSYGKVIPSPGVDEHLFAQFGVSALQQAAARHAGWEGSEAGGTNVLLDAYLRSLHSRVDFLAASEANFQFPGMLHNATPNDVARILFRNSSTGDVVINGLDIWSSSSLIANDTNYFELGLYVVDLGFTSPVLLAVVDTKTAGSGGTGDWAPFVRVPVGTGPFRVPPNKVLLVEAVQHGLGVDVPVFSLIGY